MVGNYIASLANGGLRAAPSRANQRDPAPPSEANGGFYADSNRSRYPYYQYGQGRPYDYRPTPQYYPQQKPVSPFGFLAGLFAGGAIANIAGRGHNGSRSYPSDFNGTADGQMGTGKPLKPSEFESLMNDAIEGRSDIRRDSYGRVIPNEKHLMFKQVMFNILERDAIQRNGRGIDLQTQRTLFIPGIMPDGENPMPRNERGTHITHFSDNFGSQRLSQIVDKNYDLLRDAYAHEYRQYQQYQEATARQGAPRQQQSGGIARFFGL